MSNHQTLEELGLIEELSASPLTVAFVFKTSIRHAARLITDFERDDKVNLIFVRKSPGKLYISYYPPDERRHREGRRDWQ